MLNSFLLPSKAPLSLNNIHDDAGKSTVSYTAKHAITMTPAQHEREDLTESTSVVPAEYTPKVKLELLTTLEC